MASEVAVDLPPVNSSPATDAAPDVAPAAPAPAPARSKKEKTPEELLEEKRKAIKTLLGGDRVLDVPPVEGSIVARLWRYDRRNFLLILFGTFTPPPPITPTHAGSVGRESVSVSVRCRWLRSGMGGAIDGCGCACG